MDEAKVLDLIVFSVLTITMLGSLSIWFFRIVLSDLKERNKWYCKRGVHHFVPRTDRTDLYSHYCKHCGKPDYESVDIDNVS